MAKRHLAITMGDPAGIGPEIIVKACARLRDRLTASDLKLLIIGSRRAFEQANRQLSAGLDVADVNAEDARWPNLGFLQADEESASIEPGVLSADGGRFAYKAVEQGVRLALSGRIGGIVTAPLNKEALNKAGYHYPGHTEMLAELTGVRGSVMLLAHGNMRVSHVSTHVALQDVPSRLTPERLRHVIGLTEKALLGIGIARPKIAVAALNPHAGEGGLFGRQDIDVSAPTIAKAVDDGLDVVGPLAGAFRRQHHAGLADYPHLRRSRHGLRHRRQGHCQRAQPDRGHRLRRAPGRRHLHSSNAMRPDAQ